MMFLREAGITAAPSRVLLLLPLPPLQLSQAGAEREALFRRAAAAKLAALKAGAPWDKVGCQWSVSLSCQRRA